MRGYLLTSNCTENEFRLTWLAFLRGLGSQQHFCFQVVTDVYQATPSFSIPVLPKYTISFHPYDVVIYDLPDSGLRDSKYMVGGITRQRLPKLLYVLFK